jgi:hypothetical protein
VGLPSMTKKSEKLDVQKDQCVKLFASKAAVPWATSCGTVRIYLCTVAWSVTGSPLAEVQLLRSTGHHSERPNGSSPQRGSTRKLQHAPGLSVGSTTPGE